MRNWRRIHLRLLLCLGILCASCGNALQKEPYGSLEEKSPTPDLSPAVGMLKDPDVSNPLGETVNPAHTVAADVENQDRPTCGSDTGQIEQKVYGSFLTGEAIPVYIYLPPCYDPYLRVYPVVILLHGKPQDERHWLLLGIEGIVTPEILAGAWPSMVLVMPLQPEPLFSQTDGGAGSYEQELLQGLVSHILDRYAVSGDAGQWAIAGISRGGVWALEIGLRNPDLFQHVGALSPALNVNYPNPAYDPFQIAADTQEFPAGVFLGVGDVDSARAKVEEFARVLEDAGIQHQLLVVEGSHESATWVTLIPALFRSLAMNW